MIRDEPQAATLLAEARSVLSDTILPILDPSLNYEMHMALKAISLAEQQLNADAKLELMLLEKLDQILSGNDSGFDQAEVLAERIRRGALDASVEIFDFLDQLVNFKFLETTPTGE